MDTARRMGWRPNPLASAYMAHLRRSKPLNYQANLAFLISNPESGRLSEQPTHSRSHYLGAKERAAQFGYGMEPLWLNEPLLTARRLTGILRSRNIPGVIVPGMVSPEGILDGLGWRHFTPVALGYTSVVSRFHRVTANTSAGFMVVLENVRRLGYRKIGVVVSRAYDEQVNHGVLFPAYYIRDRWGGDCDMRICDFQGTGEADVAIIQAWLREHRPEIILGEETTWQAVRRMGWRVPQDVAFANVDVAPEYPHIAGLNQRHELHGAVAVDVLVGQLAQNERGLPEVPRVVLVPGAWSEGLSAPPAEKRTRVRLTVNR